MKQENKTKWKNKKEKIKLNVQYEKKKWTIRKKHEIKRTIRKKTENFKAFTLCFVFAS